MHLAKGNKLRFRTAKGFTFTARLADASDLNLLLEGFEHLSQESRYLRFFTAVSDLNDAMIAQLIDIDQYDHLAIAAFDPDGDESPEGNAVGIIRIIRSTTDTTKAEYAVTVIDDYQRQGLGSLLMAIAADVGLQIGITTLTGVVLATNGAMLGVVKALGGHLESEPEDRTIVNAVIDSQGILDRSRPVIGDLLDDD